MGAVMSAGVTLPRLREDGHWVADVPVEPERLGSTTGPTNIRIDLGTDRERAMEALRELDATGHEGRTRPWTTGERARLTEMRRRGMTVYAIARELGRTPGTVYKALSQMHFTLEQGWTPEETEWLGENYHDHGVRECAAALGRTESAVKIKASRLGLARGGGDVAQG